MEQTAASSTPPVLLKIEQFAAKHIAWSPAALRALILNSRDRQNSRGQRVAGNGLEPAVVKVGRRVLIDEQKFFSWIAQQQRNGRRAA